MLSRTPHADSIVCSLLIELGWIQPVPACHAGVPVSVDEALRAATWLPQIEGSHPRRVHLSSVV